MSDYPYADRFPVLRGMPSEGRDRKAIIAELREIATEEDKTGRPASAPAPCTAATTSTTTS